MNFTEEARQIAVSLGRDYPDVIERIAAALQSAHERGKAEAKEHIEYLQRALQEIRDNEFHNNEYPSMSDAEDFADRVLRNQP